VKRGGRKRRAGGVELGGRARERERERMSDYLNLETEQARLELELQRVSSHLEKAREQAMKNILTDSLKKQQQLQKDVFSGIVVDIGRLFSHPGLTLTVALASDFEKIRMDQINQLITDYISQPQQQEIRHCDFFLEVARFSWNNDQLKISVIWNPGVTPRFDLGCVNIPYQASKNLEDTFYDSVVHHHHQTLEEGDYFTLSKMDQKKVLREVGLKEQQLIIKVQQQQDTDEFSFDPIYSFMEQERLLMPNNKKNPQNFQTPFCKEHFFATLKNTVVSTLQHCENAGVGKSMFIPSKYMEAIWSSSLCFKKKDVKDGCDFLSRERPFYYYAPRERVVQSMKRKLADSEQQQEKEENEKQQKI
jgi:transcriptional antiterminator Rof (Rho-off)